MNRYGNKTPYDFLRNRIVFPIKSEGGRVVAFAGRSIGETKEAKYLNTKATRAFRKSAMLYGLDVARRSGTGSVYVVDGYLDVMRMHQYGYRAVAKMGMVLTNKQIEILKKFDSIALIPDAEPKAWTTTAERLYVFPRLLDGKPIDVGILMMPEGEDPDSMLRDKPQDVVDAIIGAKEDAYKMCRMCHHHQKLQGMVLLRLMNRVY